jgi:hypothetical protein
VGYSPGGTFADGVGGGKSGRAGELALDGRGDAGDAERRRLVGGVGCICMSADARVTVQIDLLVAPMLSLGLMRFLYPRAQTDLPLLCIQLIPIGVFRWRSVDGLIVIVYIC